MGTGVILGSEIKLNIHIDPIDGYTVKREDWTAKIYCVPQKSISIEGKNTTQLTDNDFLVCVSTGKLGIGTIKCKITAMIPDAQYSDTGRTEIAVVNTGIVIKNE